MKNFFLYEVSREHGLSFSGRVIRLELLVLIHFLLHGQHLSLQLGAQGRQSVTDVVGQGLGGARVGGIVRMGGEMGSGGEDEVYDYGIHVHK